VAAGPPRLAPPPDARAVATLREALLAAARALGAQRKADGGGGDGEGESVARGSGALAPAAPFSVWGAGCGGRAVAARAPAEATPPTRPSSPPTPPVEEAGAAATAAADGDGSGDRPPATAPVARLTVTRTGAAFLDFDVAWEEVAEGRGGGVRQ
jgi:hypothetical protein